MGISMNVPQLDFLIAKTSTHFHSWAFTVILHTHTHIHIYTHTYVRTAYNGKRLFKETFEGLI